MRVILDVQYRGWILEAIIKESLPYIDENVKILYIANSRRSIIKQILINRSIFIPKIKSGDLCVNQNTLVTLTSKTKKNDFPILNSVRVFFTHEDMNTKIVEVKRDLLKKVGKVIVMNSESKRWLVANGLEEAHVVVAYGAIDRKIFYPLNKNMKIKDKYIYIVGDSKPRKNPQKILEVIANNPDIKFIINGDGWQKTINEEARNLKNVSVTDFDFKNHPNAMRMASAVLTLSLIEGGPYPVLEALASGTPVVATPTGWNAEIVNNANGRIISFEASIQQIGEMLHECINLKETVMHKDLLDGKFTWQQFANFLYR
jgi:glycosyltransferase involved in cell wall biosynthesis